MNFTIDRDKAIEFKELMEDTMEYWCDENVVSGELTLVLMEAFIEAKKAQFTEAKTGVTLQKLAQGGLGATTSAPYNKGVNKGTTHT